MWRRKQRTNCLCRVMPDEFHYHISISRLRSRDILQWHFVFAIHISIDTHIRADTHTRTHSLMKSACLLTFSNERMPNVNNITKYTGSLADRQCTR